MIILVDWFNSYCQDLFEPDRVMANLVVDSEALQIAVDTWELEYKGHAG